MFHPKFSPGNGVDDICTSSLNGVAENLDVTDGVTQQLVQILHTQQLPKFTTPIRQSMEAAIV